MYNVRGDVIQLLGFDGEVDKTYDYDAYGNELQRDLSDENPFRYCGEYYDTETGFIYLRARYYDPMVGRFTSVDPIKDGLNWYSYCENDPVNFVDPTGLRLKEIKYIAFDDYGTEKSTAPSGVGAPTNQFREHIKEPIPTSGGAPIHDWLDDVIIAVREYDITSKDGKVFEGALEDSDRHGGPGVFTSKFGYGRLELPNVDLNEATINILSAEVDLLTGCSHLGKHLDLSWLDIGHAQVDASIGIQGIEVGAFASAYSPGAHVLIRDVKISALLEVGAFGLYAKINGDGISFRAASVIGFSLDISW